MNQTPSFVIQARVVQAMPVAPRVGLSFDLAVEQVVVLRTDPGGPAVSDIIPVAHANAPEDEAYRRVGALHTMRVQRGLPDDAVLWSDFPVRDADVWFCTERLDELPASPVGEVLPTEGGRRA